MISEFSPEAMEEWGGRIDTLSFGHCQIKVIHNNWVYNSFNVVRITQTTQTIGVYNKSKGWKLKALIDAFKHFDTEEDKAVLAQLIVLRMTQS